MKPDLFIGVVTYPGTRFPEAAQPNGLAHSIARILEGQGWTCEVQVFDRNEWTPELLPIDQDTIGRSIDAELRVETEWRRFQGSRMPTPVLAGFMALRRSYRRRKFLPKHHPVNDEHPGFRMVRRLVNIETAHLALMETAVKAEATWALILEDDASGDPQEVATVVMALIAKASGQPQPLYVNVSRSFSDDELKVGRHMHDLGKLSQDVPSVTVNAADRPVTNTVCAVLYRKQFLDRLLDQLESMPLDPVIPIDWKLNQALIKLSHRERITAGDCWSLMRAPIAQGSMRAGAAT